MPLQMLPLLCISVHLKWIQECCVFSIHLERSAFSYLPVVSKNSIMVILSWITSRILFLLPSWIPVLTVLVGHVSNTAFLCQKIKVLAPQSYPTFCNPMDCSLPGSSAHGILQARILEWGCHFLLQGIFSTQGLKLGLLHCANQAQVLYESSQGWKATHPFYRWRCCALRVDFANLRICDQFPSTKSEVWPCGQCGMVI